MRVTIEHQRKTVGGLRAIPQVDVITHVEFSEEERLIIERRRLQDYVVLQREPDSQQAAKLEPEELERWASSFHLRISDLMKGRPDRFAFDTPADAKLYHQRLTEALKELKAFIMNNANLAPPTHFEL